MQQTSKSEKTRQETIAEIQAKDSIWFKEVAEMFQMDSVESAGSSDQMLRARGLSKMPPIYLDWPEAKRESFTNQKKKTGEKQIGWEKMKVSVTNGRIGNRKSNGTEQSPKKTTLPYNKIQHTIPSAFQTRKTEGHKLFNNYC